MTIILSLSFITFSACAPEEEEPEVEEKPWLTVQACSKDFGDNIYLGSVTAFDIKTSKTPGWWIEYENSSPTGTMTDQGVLILPSSTNLVNVVYTNGVERIVRTINLYAYNPNAPIDLILTEAESKNGYVLKTKFIVNLGEKIVLSPSILYNNKEYRDGSIENVTIEDESIVSYDAEKLEFNALKVGTTKVVVDATIWGIRWYTYHRADMCFYHVYQGLQDDPDIPGRNQNLIGSAGLRRQFTIEVVE